MREILKEHFILLLGIGLFTYGLFGFILLLETGAPICALFSLGTGLGAVLIVIGLLKMRKKKGGN